MKIEKGTNGSYINFFKSINNFLELQPIFIQ